jgi:uncharacterized SAM-binding protein YcdF (DUF218 family)
VNHNDSESTPTVRRLSLARRLIRAALLIAILLGGLFDSLLLTINHTGQQDQTRPADAILIPGSGVNYDGSPSPNFLARIEHGLRLYQGGYAPLIALTGGSRREELREEARVAEEILLARGVPPEAILVEDRSQSTEENIAYVAPLLRERVLSRSCWSLRPSTSGGRVVSRRITASRSITPPSPTTPPSRSPGVGPAT